MAKVDPWVMQTALSRGETEFLVFLVEQADVSGTLALQTKLEKGTYVFETLQEVSALTQAPVLQVLENAGALHRAYWIVNMVWVRGDIRLVEQLARRADVAHLYANPWVKADLPLAGAEGELRNPQWGVSKINAPALWELGYAGQAVVIAGQDTGYEWTHPILKDRYRGWDGVTAVHDYNWHDAIHEDDLHTSPGNPCGFDAQAPCDDHGHGTHTMGTMAGINGFGVAPQARWIGCRNMEEGWGKPSTYIECYQWFIAPTDLSGQNPDPSKAPHIINNSWGCPTNEGCTDPNVMLAVVENVQLAGILTVHSAGNSGSLCSTVNTPAAIYDASFTVGSVNSFDVIASSSSRGPVFVDGSGRMKPDISAPGVSIYSAWRGGGYVTSSGTSMAAPHVAGAAALLISADLDLASQPGLLRTSLQNGAVPLTTTQTCGGDTPTTVPNNVYGYGRIDAFESALNMYPLISSEIYFVDTQSVQVIDNHAVITGTLEVQLASGLMDLENVQLSQILPVSFTLASASGTYDYVGHEILWQKAALIVGDSWVVTFTASMELSQPVTITQSAPVLNADGLNRRVGQPVVWYLHPTTSLFRLFFPLINK